MSSSQPIICVPKRTHRVFSQNSPSLPRNSVSSLLRNSIPPVSFFLRIAFQETTFGNRRFEAIRANRSNVVKIQVSRM